MSERDRIRKQTAMEFLAEERRRALHQDRWLFRVTVAVVLGLVASMFFHPW